LKSDLRKRDGRAFNRIAELVDDTSHDVAVSRQHDVDARTGLRVGDVDHPARIVRVFLAISRGRVAEL
jgi:hypothetical protein